MYSTNNHGLMKKGVLWVHIFISLGQIPKSQSIQVQSPTISSFSNVDLMWAPKVRHWGINKVSIDIAYITHMSKFLEGEWGDGKTLVDYNTQIFAPTKWYQYPINKKPPRAYLV